MSFESGLAGKVAIVTGGSRGIGRAIVECLAAQGVDVNFFYRGNEAAALEVVASVTASGGKATALQVDVGDSAACIEAVNAVADRCERIDILVNNAGIVRDNLMAAMEDEEISAVLQTNIGGVFNVTRPVIPFMMSQRAGRIVNLSSVAGSLRRSRQRILHQRRQRWVWGKRFARAANSPSQMPMPGSRPFKPR